jgi:hypothetical protein
MDAERMRNVIDVAFAKPNMITDGEKEFVRMRHDQFSCEEYTRVFENSSYYKSPGKREAMARWHWETFHSRVAHSPAAISESAEPAADSAQ